MIIDIRVIHRERVVKDRVYIHQLNLMQEKDNKHTFFFDKGNHRWVVDLVPTRGESYIPYELPHCSADIFNEINEHHINAGVIPRSKVFTFMDDQSSEFEAFCVPYVVGQEASPSEIDRELDVISQNTGRTSPTNQNPGLFLSIASGRTICVSPENLTKTIKLSLN